MNQMGLPVVKRSTRQAIHAYVAANADRYCKFAERITPDLTVPDQVYTRVAFAILSANAPFERSVDALRYCHATGWKPDAFALGPTMVPAKASYIRKMAERSYLWYLKPEHETWDIYRTRLIETAGLGMAKASFAACLLYPMDADLACVDTWMQKVILGETSFTKISAHRYRQCESWVRRIARRHGVPTFIAQWLIWDHARGVTSDHNIFPSSHKGSEWLSTEV